MQVSHFFMPVEIFMGDECVESNKESLCSLGKRASIITYDMPEGIRHYALEDVKKVLDEQGIPYFVSTGVKEDPTVSSIDAIRKEAADFQADFIIAIGGGSAMDTGKSVACILRSKMSTLDALFAEEQLSDRVPLAVVPTTCGTGSEVSAWIAVSRDDIVYKGPAKQKIFPTYAFLDAKYISELPLSITRATLLDALCHAAESYVNVKSNPFYRACGEAAMKLFGKCKDSLIEGDFIKEDRENALLCASLAGIAMTECGSSLTHGCSYPISLDKHMPHGLACASTIAPYFGIFKDRTVVDQMLSWCGFKDLDEMRAYMDQVIGDDLKKYDVTMDDIEKWSDEMEKQTGRFAVHPEPAGRNEVFQMYKEAFAL